MTARVSSPHLIGRAHEMARLRELLGQARGGRSAAALLSGEAGVGKTRLSGEFAEWARSGDTAVLTGGCIDLGDGALPYGPVVEALRGLTHRMNSEELDAVFGRDRTELARLVPDLGVPAADSWEARTTPRVTAPGLSLGSAQGRLFELVLAVLDRLAARTPVLFVIEDLHWSDRSTRDLLGFLVRNLRDTRTMLLMTYRSDELHRRHPLLPFLAELERTGRVERLELQPFDRRESAEQLGAISGHELAPALLDSIHTRSGGNPFFAEELLAAAGEEGTAELPPTLRDVLLARVADLAEPTQEFLGVASAAGQRVEPALLAAALAMDETQLYHALRECVARQVLVPDPSAGSERYAFRHALLQEAVYDDLLPGERIRLHSAFARTLEATAAGNPSHAAELAYHWHAAYDLPRALEASVAAGVAAESRYAFAEALTHYERAIELWERVPDAAARAHRDHVDLLATAAGAARYVETERALAHIQTAIKLVDPSDNVRLGLLYERLGRYSWAAGHGQAAQEWYRKSVEVIPSDPPSEPRARAMAGLAQILMLSDRFAEAQQLAEEARAYAQAVGARDLEGHALNTRGLSRSACGEVDEGIRDLAAALAIAEETGVLDDVGRAYANWAWVLDTAGRVNEAVEVSKLGIAVSEGLGLMRFFGTHLLCNQADYLFRLGRWEEAERAIRRVGEIGPFGVNEILEQELLGRLALARGRLDDAERHLAPLAPLAERAVDVQFVAPVQASLAELRLWQGRPEEAAAGLRDAINLIGHSAEIRASELHALAIRANAEVAEAARTSRDPEVEREAVACGEAVLDAVKARHSEVVEKRQAFEPLSRNWLLLCEAETTRLRRQPDPAAWEAAREGFERIGRTYVVAYIRWRAAEARLERRGDRRLAAESLRDALDLARRLGAEPLEAEIVGLASRARLSLELDEAVDEVQSDGDRAPAEDAGYGLTAREREVLGLVALGRSNRQIAEELFISVNTAGVHVSNILGKLGVSTRGEAAAMAYRLGLVETVAP